MRDLVERLYVVVGLPRLHPRQYQALFKTLAEQSGQRKNITEITRNARDRAIEDGTPIARQPFGFVTKALFFQGCAIGDAEVSAEEIARLFRNNVQERARGAQLDLEGDDVRLLNELLGVPPEHKVDWRDADLLPRRTMPPKNTNTERLEPPRVCRKPVSVILAVTGLENSVGAALAVVTTRAASGVRPPIASTTA